MTTELVCLSLGSNVGDRAANLRSAVRHLEDSAAIERTSSLYETVPVGVTDQPLFLNLAVAARTDEEPEQLLKTVKWIENAVGRRPTYRWGPRVVDVDILLYGHRSIRSRDLVIPHPEMLRRAFVLVPLAEIAPKVRHPETGETIAELCARVPGADGVRVVGKLSTTGDNT